ncbi:MAG: amidase family protein [Acidimicrobiia bacterium]|nr:amidase family protein [Acidimicrobiia bacterium]
MDLDDYLRFDAVGLAALVRAGDVSAEEARLAATTRHRDTNPAINAVVEWYDDPVPPRTLDGPLAGVPFLRKDFGATEAGRAVEMGSRLAAGLRAATTSEYFERLLDAGVQVLGRTTVPEFAQHGTTESAACGQTRNPLDVSTSSGGSSGGAASAVRAGVVPIAHASDAAGSIRIPAAVTGLIGLKPSRGLLPIPEDDWRGLVVEFVLARSVRDAEASLAALGVAPAAPSPGSLRVALSLGHWAGLAIEPAVRAAVESVAERLDALGHRIEPIECPVAYERLMSTWFPLFGGGVADAVARVAALTGRPVDGDHLEPNTLELLDRVAALGPEEPAAARRTAAAIEIDLARSLDGFDAFLTPTLDRAVIPLGRMAGDAPMDSYLADGDEWFDRLYAANVTGWAALSIPAHPPIPAADGPGLPIGAQFMARPGGEADLLRIARDLLGDAIVPAVEPGP